MTKVVAVIEGDDAAPEAMQPSVTLLAQLNLDIEWTYPPVGETAIHGSPFPDVAREMIDDADATYFGSTSGSATRALMYLRWGKQTYANVRPARYIPNANTPLRHASGIDLVIVRENLEDVYLGCEGDLSTLPDELFSRHTRSPVNTLGDGRYAVKGITRNGTERVVRFAFDLARLRAERLGRPGKLTCTSKYNVLPQTDGYFRDIAGDVASGYPDVAFETLIADDFLCRMIMQPTQFDVVVMPNLYGDLFSDGAAGLVGGLGLAPSGCYGEDYAYFESAHGTAPDIAGRNIINPTATLLSGAMMLEYLGFTAEAAGLSRAIDRVYAEGDVLTPDQGGTASTDEFVQAVAARLV